MSGWVQYFFRIIKKGYTLTSKALLIGVVIVSIFILFQAFAFNGSSSQRSAFDDLDQQRKDIYAQLDAPEYKTKEAKTFISYYRGITCTFFWRDMYR